MFKPGEVAKVRGTERTVTVINGLAPATKGYKWPVETDGGIFDEALLSPADPAVVETSTGVDPNDKWREKYASDAAQRVKDTAAGKLLSYEIVDKLEAALKSATLDFNGHWKNGAALREEYRTLQDVSFRSRDMDPHDAAAILSGAPTGIALDHWVPVDLGLRLTGYRACTCCGETDFDTETNGLTVRIAGTPCKFPDGLPKTEWFLNVPSGKIVVANDLREVFPLPEDEDFDINTALGLRQTTLAYAANGMSHAFVGNSCPGVYRCKDGSFKIANEPANERWNGKDYVPVKPAPKFDGKRLAGICTDLWWYSLCDHDEFKRRCKHFEQKPADFSIETVTVKPGVYRFQHDNGYRTDDTEKECIYTTFEWVRDSDPVEDFLGKYEEVEVNPNAYVQVMVARWPTLYGKTDPDNDKKTVPWSRMTDEERLYSWNRVADQVFCTLGGGTEWHEKGFPSAKVDSTVPDTEPPSFRSQKHWSPFSKPYGGLFEPKTLSPSFAKLAFRVLESIISFGTDVHNDNRHREVYYVRERMLVAVKRYREMAKQYPEQADPEYVAWLKSWGRAEAWVANFPLGPEFTDKHKAHIAASRWVPEDTYAVAFDANKLKQGHFAMHPKNGGCWANKDTAQRYALVAWEDNGQPAEHNCFWASHATNTGVPLYSVARVVKLGGVSHMGETLVELAFDYGTPWMQDSSKRKALAEQEEKAGITLLTKVAYEQLLPKAAQFFTDAEAAVASKK